MSISSADENIRSSSDGGATILLTIRHSPGLQIIVTSVPSRSAPAPGARRDHPSHGVCRLSGRGSRYNLSMPNEKIQKEIDSARKLGEELEEIVVSKNQVPAGERNTLLIAYWALMFDYHKGILSCSQAEFFGSSFALVRPVVEAVVRAHIAVKGSDGELAAIQTDDYKVNFKTIGPRIDADFGLEHLMENF